MTRKSTVRTGGRKRSGNVSRTRRHNCRVSVIVADDHRFMRELICRMLRRQEQGYEVVAELGDANSAVEACARLQPDLLILDINLPDESGIDAAPKLKQASPRTRILLCTAYVTDDRILEAVRSGADGFVEKTNTWNDFIHAIDRVLAGEQYFCSHSGEAFIDMSASTRDEMGAASMVALTQREREVLGLIARGHTSKEIAVKLGISTGTVDTHRVNLMKKLHIRNVAGLVVFAFRAGLIRLTRPRNIVGSHPRSL
jgi:DNA-binding NarL/FixJ family response regulator